MITLVKLRICGSLSTACLLIFFLAACSKTPRDTSGNPVVSPVPVKKGEPLARVEQLPRVEVSYGEGDCAPRFANGMRGTCIAGKPCNGFGFKDASGKIQCACFDKVGGCEENTGCSLLRRKCVPMRELERTFPTKSR